MPALPQEEADEHDGQGAGVTEEQRASYLDLMTYFWTENGDIERCTSFDRELMQAEFPELLKAWDDHKLAERMVDVVLKGLCK